MGYQGSAAATVLSEVVALGVLLIYLGYQSGLIQKYELLIRKKLQFHLIREVMRLAMPMVILHAFSLGSWVYFFSLIEKMGEKELAISMVLKQIFTAITIPGFCLASTANTIVGQLVGSRKIDLILPSVLKVIKLNYAILLSLALLTFIFRYPIVALFTTDAQVIEQISMPLIALLLAYLVIPASNVLFNSISALGNTRIPLYIETINLFFYLLYMFIFIHAMKLSLFVAWLAEIEYWFFLLLFCCFYFYKMDWKKNIIYLDKES
jgi:Na+-driven multidrug efflux pump